MIILIMSGIINGKTKMDKADNTFVEVSYISIYHNTDIK